MPRWTPAPGRTTSDSRGWSSTPTAGTGSPQTGHQQFCPFDSMEAVLADMEPGDAAPDAGQTLQETERVLGLGDWIDPETGGLAEDMRVRLEDH